MEKKNGQKICIYGLRSKGGALLLNHIKIRKRAVEFYEELYSSELCRVLTLEELQKALQSMECGRAPGIDGLSADF